MPTNISVSDVLSSVCPSRNERVNSVASGTTTFYGASTVVPESAYQSTFSTRAMSMANASSSSSAINQRNKIVRGIQGKAETYATLEVLLGSSRTDKDGLDYLKSTTNGQFAEFLLQTANEITDEKHQIVETFGDPVVFFYGERPKIYQYSGTLLNTEDYSWRDGWKSKYADELRGTQCVKERRRAYLTYDFVLREGYLLGMNISQLSANPNHVDFGFTMFITREINLKPKNVSDLISTRDKALASVRSNAASLSAKFNPAPAAKFFKNYMVAGAKARAAAQKEAIAESVSREQASRTAAAATIARGLGSDGMPSSSTFAVYGGM